jgi:hypothetical protein
LISEIGASSGHLLLLQHVRSILSDFLIVHVFALVELTMLASLDIYDRCVDHSEPCLFLNNINKLP